MSTLDLERDRPLLIGALHLDPTPGAPRFDGSLERLFERAANDARALAAGGADALVVENFGDAPFFADRVPPETVAALALAVAAACAAAPELPVGVNVLRNDARAALGICAATRASFVRINVHTGVAVSDQGLLQGDAARTLRERARLFPGQRRVQLLCDVHVKHARPLGERSLEDEAADTVLRGLADALIATGAATGAAPDRETVRRLRAASSGRPVLIGSGLTPFNAAELLGSGASTATSTGTSTGAAGAIVGTWLKGDGRVENPVDESRVRELRAALDHVR